jgi:hypothetical protein
LRLHATELLMLLGNAVLMAVEPRFQREVPVREWPPQPEVVYPFSSPSS